MRFVQFVQIDGGFGDLLAQFGVGHFFAGCDGELEEVWRRRYCEN
jgi:hypothetical protein